MPRNIPVGNGSLLIAFDQDYRLRDVYYPWVGLPNHTGGHVQRFGVWVDGKFAWIEDADWQRDLRYKPDTMVTEVTLRHEKLGLELICHDAVDYHSPVYFRRIVVTDLTDTARDVRVFFHHDLSLGGSPVGDTVAYDPDLGGLVHYKDDVYFLINGCDERKCGIDHFATGAKRIGGAEGTWRDAEDGHLSHNAIAQGSVDSTVGFNLHLSAGGSSHVIYWLAAGDSYEEIQALNQKILTKTAERMMTRTEAYWRLWACKEPVDFSPLPEPIRDLYMRSQLIMRTQIDNGGAIIAANDSDITHFAGDTYSYVWPRDGALVAYALVLAGHGELSRAFFRFCERVIGDRGYFLHKYHPTGTLASSWHPRILDGQTVLPIQQDETALVIWALREHFLVFRDVEFIKSLYNPLVVDPANWMLEHQDHNGLPRPSWDLWEERRGVHTFTVGATIGALDAAAGFARDMGAMDNAARFKEGAERMRGALMRHLWVPEQQRFARMATPTEDGTYRLDMTVDAANYGVFAFGALPADDPAVVAEMKAIRDRLWIDTPIGGVARYERDYYQQVEREDIERIPGNPWVICTLWLAQHAIEVAKTEEELAPALEYLQWTQQRALSSGVLAEQYHPTTGEPYSVSPLTWSHAVVITTVMQYLMKHAELTGRRVGALAELINPDLE
ncbi:MAG: glycoside hydrolase family 15 protein [Phycisphaerales bacterium]|nr:glycoside hydrolase family 15 protein [Phycisphaerae bacterium]NNF42199.1 glycoside hydrolase family 15 protein [Phycisphaerales bacterium]NNM26846.1 glycoside hydrolase family 15 protein [Phycisphaerales bacterium]